MQDEFRVPTTEDGRPIPLIWGRAKLSGPNVIYQRYVGNQRIRRRSGLFSKTTVGYRYAWALHFGVCGEIETLHRMWWGGKPVIEGTFTEAQTLPINLGDLFGGDRGGGGIVGDAQLLWGAPDYEADGLLLEEQPGGPAYRGQFGVLYRGLVGNTETIRPTEFEVSRYTAAWPDGTAWHPELAYVPLNEAAEGGAQTFTFVFVVCAAGRMGDPVAFLGPSRLAVSRGMVTAAINQLITIKQQFGSGIVLNVMITQYTTSASGTLKEDASVADLEDLRDFYSGLAASGFYFISAAAQGILVSHTVLDAQGVTGPRTFFVFTAGEDTPTLIDGPTFGTPDSRLVEAITDSAPVTNQTGDFSPTSGRVTTLYRVQLGGSSDGLSPSQMHNGAAGVIRAFSPGSQTLANLISGEVGSDIEEAYFGANLAHIVYEAITTPRPLGMGYPSSAINDANFLAVAQQIYNERLGLCLTWQFDGPVEDLLASLQDHTGSIIEEDPITGQWCITLLRGDYDPDALPVFGDDEILGIEEFQRANPGELVTSISVTYRDVFTFTDRTTPPLRDLALIQEQGAENLDKRDYPWLPTMAIAMRIADRDMQLATLPLFTSTVKLTRAAYGVRRGDVIKLSHPRLGLTAAIVRVIAVDYGTLTDGVITIGVAEDRFGLADSVYTVGQPIDSAPPDTRPLPSLNVAGFELPYQVIAQPGGPSSVADGIGYVGALAAPPANLLTEFDLYTSTDPAALVQDAEGQFVPFATLAAAASQTDATLSLAGAVNLDAVQVGDYAIVGTGAAAEWMRVVSLDPGAPSVTVSRGLLDTTPALALWPVGTPVWFADGTEAAGETAYSDGTAVIAAVATVGPSATLAADAAPADTVTLANRASRPLPPGNVLINGEAYPGTVTGVLTVTWSARDRLTQPDNVLQTAATDYGPEAGTTYNVYAYDVTTETLLDSDTGLTSPTWSPVLPDAYPLRIEIEAERGGLVSWQRQQRQFTYVSVDLTGRETEDGDARETESGEIRITD